MDRNKAILHGVRMLQKAVQEHSDLIPTKPLPSVQEIRHFLDRMNPQPGNPNNHQIELVLMAIKGLK